MKITHHLGHFATFFKESSFVIQLLIVASTISLVAGTATVVAKVSIPNNNRESTSSTITESNDIVSDTNADNQPSAKNDNEQVDTKPEDQTTSKPTVSTSTQSSSQTTPPPTPTTTAAQPTQTATGSNPQQTATNPNPPIPTCNESMKSSYTNLYNSQVNEENANWYNQIDSWNAYAAGHGTGFGGYVQGMINDNQPAHDARLAQLQTQYYLNLASINCNP